MSTRSTTIFWSKGMDSKPLGMIYKQCDGYPSWLGAYYVEKLTASEASFKSMKHFSLWVFRSFKAAEYGSIENIIYMPVGNSKITGLHGDHNQEYLYDIYECDGLVCIRCQFVEGCGDNMSLKLIYDGPAQNWMP